MLRFDRVMDFSLQPDFFPQFPMSISKFLSSLNFELLTSNMPWLLGLKDMNKIQKKLLAKLNVTLFCTEILFTKNIIVQLDPSTKPKRKGKSPSLDES